MRSALIAGVGVLLASWNTQPCSGQSPPGGETADTVVVSLTMAEDLAIRNHPRVRQAALDLSISEARERQASRARFLPKLELTNVWGAAPRARGEFTDTGVLVSPDTSTSISDLRFFTEVALEAVQPIHTFGRLDGLVSAARFGVEASRSGIDASADEVRLQARQLYWGLVLGQDLVRVADDVLDRLAEADSALQVQFDEGTASQNDVFKFQIFEYEVHKRHREATDRLTLAQAGLRAMLGIRREVTIRTETTELAPLPVPVGSLEEYMELALESRPELSQLRAGIAARSSLARSKRGEYWPQLFVAADIRWNRAPSRFDPKNPFVYNPTNFFRPGVVLGFSWNVNFFQTRDQVRLAERETARLRDQTDPLTAKIQLDVREAYLDVVRAGADLEESDRALTASANWFRAEAQTFDLGLSEIQDLVDAFQANIEMRTEHLSNIFGLNTALAELNRAVGRDIGSV